MKQRLLKYTQLAFENCRCDRWKSRCRRMWTNQHSRCRLSTRSLIMDRPCGSRLRAITFRIMRMINLHNRNRRRDHRRCASKMHLTGSCVRVLSVDDRERARGGALEGEAVASLPAAALAARTPSANSFFLPRSGGRLVRTINSARCLVILIVW